MAKKTVGVTPREQPEQVAQRIEDLVGVQPGQGRRPGQKDLISRIVELEEALEDRNEKIEHLYSLVEDLGTKYTKATRDQAELSEKIINDESTNSDLNSKIEQLKNRIEQVYSQVDQDEKDFDKLNDEIKNIQFIARSVNRQFVDYQQWVEDAIGSLEPRIVEVENRTTKGAQ